MENRRVNSIIEALAKHEDAEAINVLEKVGTNCENDDVRRLTSKALIKKNNQDSLAVVISSKGKGINDLSTSVAMSTINELLQLKDKEQAMGVLENTENSHEDEDVRETARSVKALMSFS